MADFNITQYVTGGKLPFNESEKNLVAFKGLFGITNTSDFKTKLGNERFAKSFNIYPSDIISEESSIDFNPPSQANIIPGKIRYWVTQSNLTNIDGDPLTDPIERLYRGHFSESINPNGNPVIEQIICPLTKVYGTTNQFYVALAKENMTAEEYGRIFNQDPNEFGEGGYEIPSGSQNVFFGGVQDETTQVFTQLKYFDSNTGDNEFVRLKEADISPLFNSSSKILKNFISPFKFGSNYTAEIYPSYAHGSRLGDEITNADDGFTYKEFTLLSNNYSLNFQPLPAQGTPNFTNFRSDTLIDPSETITSDENKFGINRVQKGGLLIDYKEGFMFVGAQTKGKKDNPGLKHESGSAPNIAGFTHPLWIKAYRYTGKTGGGGGGTDLSGSGVISGAAQLGDSISNLTNGLNPQINDDGVLSFNTGESVNIEDRSTPIYRIEFGRRIDYSLEGGRIMKEGPSNFSLFDYRLSSSIMVRTGANAYGQPFVSRSANNGLFINTVHGSDSGLYDLGYYIHFSSSLLENDVLGLGTTTHDYSITASVPSGLYKQTESVSKMVEDFEKPFIGVFDNIPKATDPNSLADKGNYLSSNGFRHLDLTGTPSEEFNWFAHAGSVFGSGKRSFKYKRLKFDPSGMTSGSLANELKDFINANCSQHVKADVIIENGIPRLEVEQVYAGFPTNPYWDPGLIHYKSGSYTTGIAGLTIMPHIGTGSGVIGFGKFGDGDYTGSLQPTASFTGSINFYNTWKPGVGPSIDTRTSMNLWCGDMVGSPNFAPFQFSIGDPTNITLGVSVAQMPYIQFNRNAFSTNNGGDKVHTEMGTFITRSGNLFGKDSTLINGKTGPVNPSAGSIGHEIFRRSQFTIQETGFFPAPTADLEDRKKSMLSVMATFYDARTSFKNSSVEFPYPIVEITSGSLNSTPSGDYKKINGSYDGATRHISTKITASAGSKGIEFSPINENTGTINKFLLRVAREGIRLISSSINSETGEETTHTFFSTVESVISSSVGNHIISMSDAYTGENSFHAVTGSFSTFIVGAASTTLGTELDGELFGHGSVYESALGLFANISGGKNRSATVEAFPGVFSPATTTDEFVNVNIIDTINVGGTLTLAQSLLDVTSSYAVSSDNSITSSHALNLEPNIDIITSNITASNISSSGHISASNLFVSGNTSMLGDLALEGNFDFEGFSFTGETVVQLTGSNTFGQTSSFNQHTFTGSIVISSSQDNAFSIVDEEGINFSIAPNGTINTNITASNNISASGTGSFSHLIITSSKSYISIGSSANNGGAGQLANVNGNLYWGDDLIGNSSGLEGLTLIDDPNPTLMNNLQLNGNSIIFNDTVPDGAVNVIEINQSTAGRGVFISSTNINLLNANITQQHLPSSTLNTLQSTNFTGAVTASTYVVKSSEGDIVNAFKSFIPITTLTSVHPSNAVTASNNTLLASVGSGNWGNQIQAGDTIKLTSSSINPETGEITTTIHETTVTSVPNSNALHFSETYPGIEDVEYYVTASKIGTKRFNIGDEGYRTTIVGSEIAFVTYLNPNIIRFGSPDFPELNNTVTFHMPISMSGGFPITASNFRGNLDGTASYALVAETVLNGGTGGTGVGFPFQGEAIISGSLEITTINQLDLSSVNNTHITTNLYSIGEIQLSDTIETDNLVNFDGNTSGAQLNKFIQYNFGGALGFNPIINKVNLHFNESILYNHKQVAISGSHDGEIFTPLGIETLQDDNVFQRDFTFTNNTAFAYYRLQFNDKFQNSDTAYAGQFLGIKRFTFFANSSLYPGIIIADQITGSLHGTASQAITASHAFLSNHALTTTTASYALTASHASVADSVLNPPLPFPFQGEAIISGSLELTTINELDLSLVTDDFITTTLFFGPSTFHQRGLLSDTLIDFGDNAEVGQNISTTDVIFNNDSAGNIDKDITYDFGGALGFNPVINKINLHFYGGNPFGYYAATEGGFGHGSHKQVEVLGSNNGTDFTQIAIEELLPTQYAAIEDFEGSIGQSGEGEFDNAGDPYIRTKRDFSFTNNTPYRYYQLKFNEHFQEQHEDVLVPRTPGDLLSIRKFTFFANSSLYPGIITADQITGSLHGIASQALTASHALTVPGYIWHNASSRSFTELVTNHPSNAITASGGGTAPSEFRLRVSSGQGSFVNQIEVGDAIRVTSSSINPETGEITTTNFESTVSHVVGRFITMNDAYPGIEDVEHYVTASKMEIYNFITSSKDVHVTQSLFVSKSITTELLTASQATFTNSLTEFFTSSKVLIPESLVVGTPFQDNINPYGTDQASLTVNQSLFIGSPLDNDPPSSEGILISTDGDNNSAGGKIFFKRDGTENNGLSLMYNPGSSNEYLGTNFFAIKNHNDNPAGDPNFVIDLENTRVGIGVAAPEFDLDVGGDVQISKKLFVGKTITSSGGILSEGDVTINVASLTINKGDLIFSSSEQTNQEEFKVLVQDTDTSSPTFGKIFHTGSYRFAPNVKGFPYAGSTKEKSLPGTPAPALITGSLFVSGGTDTTIKTYGNLVVSGGMLVVNRSPGNFHIINGDTFFGTGSVRFFNDIQFFQHTPPISPEEKFNFNLVTGETTISSLLAPGGIRFDNHDNRIYDGLETIFIAPNDTDVIEISEDSVYIDSSLVELNAPLKSFDNNTRGNLTASIFNGKGGNISASGYISASELHIKNDSNFEGNVNIGGNLDYSGLSFTEVTETVVNFTGDNTFGTTIANTHTFTGSIVITSSQDNAFSIINGDDIALSITNNGTISSSTDLTLETPNLNLENLNSTYNQVINLGFGDSGNSKPRLTFGGDLAGEIYHKVTLDSTSGKPLNGIQFDKTNGHLLLGNIFKSSEGNSTEDTGHNLITICKPLANPLQFPDPFERIEYKSELHRFMSSSVELLSITSRSANFSTTILAPEGIEGQAASFKTIIIANDNITTNGVIVVGEDNTLTNYANFAHNGSTLSFSGTGFKLDAPITPSAEVDNVEIQSNLNVIGNITSSGHISASGVIYGKQRESSCHNHGSTPTGNYYLPFKTDQEFASGVQSPTISNTLQTNFLAPYDGKLIKAVFYVHAPLNNNFGVVDLSLIVNNQNQGHANVGPITSGTSNFYYFDPSHPNYGQGNSTSTIQNNSFKAGSKIRILVRPNSGYSANYVLCTLTWEYEYDDSKFS